VGHSGPIGKPCVRLLRFEFSLLAVIILPWNLYFEAKEIQQEQKISSNKEIQLEEDDLEFTRRLPAKMLALALSLHLADAAASYFLYSVAKVYW